MTGDDLVTGVEPGELYDLAATVGTRAAAWVRERRPPGRVEVAGHKSSATDPVTALDRGCEELIRTEILTGRPNDSFMGEEGDEIAGDSEVRWIVDPIDGTVNFVYGIGSWAVSIAAQAGGVTVAGFIIDGVRNIAWGAIAGQGAWRSDDPGRRLSAGGVRDLSHALVGTGFHYQRHIREHQAGAVAAMLPHIRDIRRLGSAALDICAVADGSLDAFVEQGLQPWDLAAGELIAHESGAVVSGLYGPADERLVMVVTPGLKRDFFELINVCGF